MDVNLASGKRMGWTTVHITDKIYKYNDTPETMPYEFSNEYKFKIQQEEDIKCEVYYIPIDYQYKKIQIINSFEANNPIYTNPTNKIKIKHLLNHTAGYGYEIWDKEINELLKTIFFPLNYEIKNIVNNETKILKINKIENNVNTFIFDKFYDFAFGSKKNVDHIWKSNNYKKYKKKIKFT